MLEPVILTEPEIPLGGRIVAEALKWEGTPSIRYRGPEAGMSPEEGFDCSGFVVHVLERSGIAVPDGIRHCRELFDWIEEDVAFPRTGDLYFSSRKGYMPNHVGIVVGDTRMIHAPGKDNTVVEIRSWRDRPIRNFGENVIYSRNPIGFKRITMQPRR